MCACMCPCCLAPTPNAALQPKPTFVNANPVHRYEYTSSHLPQTKQRKYADACHVLFSKLYKGTMSSKLSDDPKLFNEERQSSCLSQQDVRIRSRTEQIILQSGDGYWYALSIDPGPVVIGCTLGLLDEPRPILPAETF